MSDIRKFGFQLGIGIYAAKIVIDIVGNTVFGIVDRSIDKRSSEWREWKRQHGYHVYHTEKEGSDGSETRMKQIGFETW